MYFNNEKKNKNQIKISSAIIISMHYKYRVDIFDIESGELKESWEYRTKGDISTTYSIPMYIID